MTLNSYFSGAGLMDMGLALAGWEPQQSFELDADCCATMRANFRHKVMQVDITQKLVADDLACDVQVFTYPCTRYSFGAELHDTRTGDELYLHALRHMVLRPPEVFVHENVPGMKAFPVVMEALSKLPGYYVTTFCPVNTDMWLPQRRPRLILIGSRRNFLWRPPEGDRISLRDIVEKNPEVEYPDYINTRLSGGYRDRPIISDPDKDDIAPTCVAHYAKDRSTRLVVDKHHPRGVRPYSVREYARLQGLPDSFTFVGGDRAAYKMIGNGVPVPIGRWIGNELTRYFKHGNVTLN